MWKKSPISGVINLEYSGLIRPAGNVAFDNFENVAGTFDGTKISGQENLSQIELLLSRVLSI